MSPTSTEINYWMAKCHKTELKSSAAEKKRNSCEKRAVESAHFTLNVRVAASICLYLYVYNICALIITVSADSKRGAVKY